MSYYKVLNSSKGKYAAKNGAGKKKYFNSRSQAAKWSASGRKSKSSSGGNRSSSNPNKYKYEYGGRSYQNKDDARAASRADKGASSSRTNHVAKQSGGSSPATDAQKAQLAQLQKTLADLQAKKSGGGNTSPTASPTTSPGGYSGGSIVDYLKSTGQGSDFASRSTLAQAQGIQGYTGSAQQNTQLLGNLRSNSSKIDTSNSIPSTALNSTLTPADVLKKQKELEGIKNSALDIQSQLNELKRVSELDPTELDPEETINDVFDQEQTDAQNKRDQLLERVSKDTERFYKDRSGDIEDAYDRFGVDEKQNALAEIQKERADRSVKLRNDIQNLETAPEFRGVSRGFANDQREAIKSKGSFDLANLAIVESAYAGDVNQSRELAQEMIDTQFDEYQGKMESYKAQLAALVPQLNEDQKRQALQIEIALDNRTRSLEEKKADTELKYDYATAVASLGAPLSVTRSILNARSADEAFMLAAPYMKEGGGDTNTSRPTETSNNPTSEYPVGDISPYTNNQGLYNTDPGAAGTSVKELEAALRTTFAPEFTAKLLSALTSEQTRDFLAGYKEASMKGGMNIDPDYALEQYLTYIGKGTAEETVTAGGGEERSAY